MVDSDVALANDVTVDVGASSYLVEVVERFWRRVGGSDLRRGRNGFWADQRPKTGGCSRPSCGPAVPQRRTAGRTQPSGFQRLGE